MLILIHTFGEIEWELTYIKKKKYNKNPIFLFQANQNFMAALWS